MSLNLQDWQDVLTAFAELRTGFKWRWENEPKPSWIDYPHGIFSGPTNIVNPATDWVTYTQDPDTLGMNPSVQGIRYMDVGCRVISRDQTASQKSQIALEKFRMALSLPRVVDGFDLLGLAVQAPTGPINMFDAPSSDKSRQDSICSMTLRLNCRPTTFTETEGDSGRLEKIRLSSEFLGLTDLEISIP